MSFKIPLLLLLCLSLSQSQEEFIDFSYTQLLEEAGPRGGIKEKIVIYPSPIPNYQYQFPEVCALGQTLGQEEQGEGAVDHYFDLDTYLSHVKNKVLQLLTLAEQIRQSRNYLTQIQNQLQLREQIPLEDFFGKHLNELAYKETELVELKLKIEAMTGELNRRINEFNANPKNQQLKAVSLNYDIENLVSKINYLKNLKEKNQREALSEPGTNFTQFFTRLAPELEKESRQIEQLELYFQNLTSLNFFKEKASSLKNNIDVDKLDIQYKMTCEKEKIDIINKASSHEGIKATLDHLRKIKRELGKGTNNYCEGVALKLETQIKGLLKAINWTFTCAEGLPELKQKLTQQEHQLHQIQQQITAFGQQGMEAYEEEYQNVRGKVQKKFSEISSFTIDRYHHNSTYLDQLIRQAEENKKKAERSLDALPKQMVGEGQLTQIKELAEKVKQEKSRFCAFFGSYDKQQQKIWFQVFQQEQIRTFSGRMRAEYLREAEELRKLEQQYRRISEEVISQLQETQELK